MGAGGSGALRSSLHLNSICKSSSFTPASAKDAPPKLMTHAINAAKANFILFVAFIVMTSSVYLYELPFPYEADWKPSSLAPIPQPLSGALPATMIGYKKNMGPT